ncbi:MAG TPA: aldehyde dehydrogenase family protein [Gemmatimonadales bacterium]|nr:aldehyde dehydrogenase family protein [Gemmatimonadales bacterium]
MKSSNPFQNPSAQSTAPPPTPPKQVDRALARLADNARRFTQLSFAARTALVRAMRDGYLAVAAESVAAACAAKGIPMDSPLVAEEWCLGPWIVVRHLRLIERSLTALARRGDTLFGPMVPTPDGGFTTRVFPTNALDAVLFRGLHIDVRLRDASRARFYHSPDHEGRVVAILGAGNVNAIAAQDVITKLFNEGKVCALKMNPVNAYLGPFLERAFAQLIARGFLAILYGGGEEGAYLVEHPLVSEVHITGSDATYNRIRPRLTKPITAELGNVSPVIVVPGEYSDRELTHQARDVAGALTYNASFDCNAAKVVVTASGWAQRAAFLAALEAAFARAAPRVPYYPGAEERCERFTRGRPDVRRIGATSGGTLPWAFCPNLDPAGQDEGFRRESFCPVLFETALPATDPVEFLDKAVELANTRLWGTLNATLVAPRATERDPDLAGALERAIGGLRYGTVAVNCFAGLGYAFSSPPWGAYPGADPADIQSGVGWVHNTAMLEGIEKVVLRHPLTTAPRPAYHPGNRGGAALGRRLTALDARGSWFRLPGVVAAALRG